MEEIEIPTASKVEPRPRIITPVSRVFDPLGRHHLSYAQPPREKTFGQLVRTWSEWTIDLFKSVGGKRFLFIGGGAIMIFGGTIHQPVLAALVIIIGMLMVESVIVMWGRGL